MISPSYSVSDSSRSRATLSVFFFRSLAEIWGLAGRTTNFGCLGIIKSSRLPAVMRASVGLFGGGHGLLGEVRFLLVMQSVIFGEDGKSAAVDAVPSVLGVLEVVVLALLTCTAGLGVCGPTVRGSPGFTNGLGILDCLGMT